jgi:hypothetical protein
LVLDWGEGGDLCAEDGGYAVDGVGVLGEEGGGYRSFDDWGKSSVGEAGGDVREGVGAVGGVDEIAEEHDVIANARQLDAVRLQGSQDGFEVVEIFGEGGVFQGFAEAWGVQGDFEGGGVGDG